MSEQRDLLEEAEIELRELREENARLKRLIDGSNLEEVAATRVDTDSCGSPVIVPSGTMLAPKDSLAREQEKTRLLQEMANMARENAKLKKKIHDAWYTLELVIVEINDYAQNPAACVAKLSELRAAIEEDA